MLYNFFSKIWNIVVISLQKIIKKSNDQKGVFFIEIILMLVMLSSLSVVLIQSINFYKKYQINKKTEDNKHIAALSIALYYKSHESIPKPLGDELCGEIPHEELGIPEEYTLNGNGVKMIYIADPKYTKQNDLHLTIHDYGFKIKDTNSEVIDNKKVNNTKDEIVYIDSSFIDLNQIKKADSADHTVMFAIVDTGKIDCTKDTESKSHNLKEINAAKKKQTNTINLKKNESIISGKNKGLIKTTFYFKNVILIYASTFL